MGILDIYNKSQYNSSGPSLSPDPIPLSRATTAPLESSFNKTSLDLENPEPTGGPINVPYMTKVGAEVITSPTTQPYTPKRTYIDGLQNPDLIARAIDPYK